MRKRWYIRGLEAYCPAEFHHYSGVAVCLEFCRKKTCSVFKNLLGADSGSSDKTVASTMKSKAVKRKDKWVNPYVVEHSVDALRLANPSMPVWMIKKALSLSLSEAVD